MRKTTPVCPTEIFFEIEQRRECGHYYICCFHCSERKKCDRNGCATRKAMNSAKECNTYPITQEEVRTLLTYTRLLENAPIGTWRSYRNFEEKMITFIVEKRKNLGWKTEELK